MKKLFLAAFSIVILLAACTGGDIVPANVPDSQDKPETPTTPVTPVTPAYQDDGDQPADPSDFSGRLVPAKDEEGWENAALCVRHMGVGWNLGNTLESNSNSLDNMWIEAWTARTPSDYETAWGQPVTKKALIHMVREAGFNAIRVPVTWYPHMGDLHLPPRTTSWNPDSWEGYDIDKAWMARVKEVVGYVLDEGMYCILNVHHDTGAESAAWLKANSAVYEKYKERYAKLWEQIATEFAGYGEKLVFESFNEMLDPYGTWNAPKDPSSYAAINSYNADFVATVRATGGNNAHRNLVLNTYAASPTESGLSSFVIPKDSIKGHIIVQVHSYAPYNFAMNEQSGQTTFDQNGKNEISRQFQLLDRYFVNKGIPCLIGEYGTTASNRTETEMCKQAAWYIKNSCKYDIPCFYWMVLTDGNDRSVPQWTKEMLMNTIISTYKDNVKWTE